MEKPERKIEHLIVISYDSFSISDWELAKSLPNLKRLIETGSYSTSVRSVYPTLTYVVHSTIVTGCWPDRHGVFHNNPLQPFIEEKDQFWHWYRKDIKVPTLYELAKQNGFVAAGILWPVTGRADIKYNLPELAAVRGENQVLKILKNGNPFYSLEMELRFGKYRNGINQPELDDFSTMCACHTIKTKKPGLLLLHLIDLDDTKHRFGAKSDEARYAILRMDERIGSIVNSVEAAGFSDHTAIIILGDHGQLDVRYKVHLNNLLLDNGLIDKSGEGYEWKAYLQSADGCAYLHVKPGEEWAEEKALQVLRSALVSERYGIEEIFDRNTLDSMRAWEGVNCVVEAKEGYKFVDSIGSEIVEDLSKSGTRHATHGYSPNKPGYSCCFVASGPGIRKNFDIGEMDMVDVAPTLAAILGLDMPDADGEAIYDIFEQQRD